MDGAQQIEKWCQCGLGKSNSGSVRGDRHLETQMESHFHRPGGNINGCIL